ncbi:MAG: YbjN domain-containing protein [Myxococcota bacterium]
MSDLKALGARLDALINACPNLVERDGAEYVVPVGARTQRLRIGLDGVHVVFSSVVARGSQLMDARGSRCSEADVLADLWARNARVDTVSFSLDRHGRVVGRIEALLATLDDEELAFYVARLAEECDRFEFVLTGEDRG